MGNEQWSVLVGSVLNSDWLTQSHHKILHPLIITNFDLHSQDRLWLPTNLMWIKQLQKIGKCLHQEADTFTLSLHGSFFLQKWFNLLHNKPVFLHHCRKALFFYCHPYGICSVALWDCSVLLTTAHLLPGQQLRCMALHPHPAFSQIKMLPAPMNWLLYY